MQLVLVTLTAAICGVTHEIGISMLAAATTLILIIRLLPSCIPCI